MEAKILLYDSNDVKIGETFMRRARQLVKQQRATWVDDRQNAIRFAPDAEDWEEAPLFPALEHKEPDDDWIIALAEKRLRARKLFMLHSIVLLPAFFMFFVIATVIANTWHSEPAWLFIGLTFGSWTTSYAIHIYLFAKTICYPFPSPNWNERKARRLAAEVAMLKNGLQR